MFGFIKKKKQKAVSDEISEKIVNDSMETQIQEDELSMLDELEDNGDTSEIDTLYGNEETDEDAPDADEYETDDEEDETDDEEDDIDFSEFPEIAKKMTSLDEFAEFVNAKAIGNIQFFNKETQEVFELREGHLRIAKIWGSVSMAREYHPAEYARIMLAIEVLNEREKFLIVPSLSEEDGKAAISEFCALKYGDSGKKYTSSPEKFAKIVKANDDMDEWRAFNKELIYDKLIGFCDDNGIVFEETGENV